MLFGKKLVRKHHDILYLTTGLALAYYSWDVNSWKFAFVGDEWPFYNFAKLIVARHFLLNPFDFHGVFWQNSILSSMYQALFLQIFGFSNFAWRFSNIILIIPITVFFYLWVKKLFSSQIAFFSTLFLQFSFYLANFFKIGKNMPQALALFLASLFAASLCMEKPTKKNFFLLGFILGISFYIYIGPLFPIIIWPFFLPLIWNIHRKKIFINSLYLIIGYLLLLLPALSNVSAMTGPAGKTFLFHEYTNNFQIVINILYNFFLFYKNFDFMYNHFVAGPYVDILTRIFVFAGTVLTILRLRELKYQLFFFTYINTCLMLGITSPYDYAPTTRGIFFLPFGALFAGIGLFCLADLIFRKKIFAKHNTLLVRTVPIAIFFFIVFLLNFYQSQVGIFKETGYSGTSLVIKELQDAQKNNIYTPFVLVLSSKNPYYGYRFIPVMQGAYDLENMQFFALNTSQLRCSSLKNTKVILFQKDSQAINTMNELHCPATSHYTTTILHPSIWL